MKKLLVSAIIDPCGIFESIEKEAEITIAYLNQHGIPCRLFQYAEYFTDEIINSNPDILLIDYGGMSINGAPGAATSQIMQACEWAESHPGKLMVIFTAFTSEVYNDELKSEFGHLNNIVSLCEFPDYKEDFTKIKKWFSL